jgi:hypothetical protein
LAYPSWLLILVNSSSISLSMDWHFKARENSPATCARCVSWLRLFASPASTLNQPLSSVVKRGKTLALLAALRNHSLGFSPAFFARPSIKTLSVGVKRIIKKSLRRIVFFGLPSVRRLGKLLFSAVAVMCLFLPDS